MKTTNRPICYRCGQPMVDTKEYEANKKQFPKEPKLTHVEHIIYNALFGKLKSNKILCKACGSEFGEKEDKGFVSLFFPIIERIKHIAIQKDHGKGSSNSLKAVLFEDEKFNSSKDVYIRDHRVIAYEPFYEYDAPNNKVLIYAENNRAKHYRLLVEKELSDQGIDPTNLTFQIQEDLSGQGILGIHFSEGIPNFNERFKPGFVKMAVGYAIHCGIDRTELPKVLRIDSDGIAHLITKENLIPFVPIGPTDALYEMNRPELERRFPSHTLILFSQQAGNQKYLFCYIDLFSTFQFYVLLNDNYKGEEIFKPFYQTVIRQEKPKIDVRGIRMKHLSIVMEQYGINSSEYSGNTIEELYEFVERKLNSLTFSPILNLCEELASSFSKLNTAYIMSQLPNSNLYKPFDSIITVIQEGQKQAFLGEMRNYFDEDDSFKMKPFRRIFLEDDGRGQLEAMSTPWECTRTAIKDKDRSAYGHLKFNQISKFIDENLPKKK